MKLAHVPAQERTDRAYLPRVLQTGDVHQPAAVVVHLNSTARANHLVGSLSHAAVLVSASVSASVSGD